MDNNNKDGAAKCPFTGATTLSSKQGSAGTGPVNRDWWPNQLKLNFLLIINNIYAIKFDGYI